MLAQRWVKTSQHHDRANPKQVYYLSMEFLIGRSLMNNVTNLHLAPAAETVEKAKGLRLAELLEQEPDAGLGNGGLGRLAACFIDSLATLQIPAIGYGLRYDYGIFRQELRDGYQVEQPDPWLTRPDPWEVARPAEQVSVPLASSFEVRGGRDHRPPRPADAASSACRTTARSSATAGRRSTPSGCGRRRPRTSSTSASSAAATSSGPCPTGCWPSRVTRVLYPDDSTPRGRSLRFLQEYFLVRCSLADIVARFRRRGNDWAALPDKVAIQLNDTHPAMAVPELMRILLDEAKLGWDQAWDLTVRTLAYTNHTLLPEALEKWPVELFEALLPRHLEIVYEINRRFLDDVKAKHPGDDGQAGPGEPDRGGRRTRKVRMANLAIVGTHSTNGVAAIHSELLRTKTVPDFAELFPDRFNNKTNGVTPRRWLLLANPDLAKLLTDAVGDGWVTDLSAPPEGRPAGRRTPGSGRSSWRPSGRRRRGSWTGSRPPPGSPSTPTRCSTCRSSGSTSTSGSSSTRSRCVVWYNRLRANPKLDVPPRTVLFAGKAAPAYHLAKVIIKLITSIGRVVNADPATRGKLRVEFLPNYSCTLAEHLIPAADVSEQISTAGYEASGTSNMKFMMNGALTVGTRDGANIEIAEEAGEENCFMFGLTADQVLGGRGWYNPLWHYENEPETRAALDLIFDNHFSPDEPGIFEPIRETLLTKGDYYMHLADLTGYVQTQEKVAALYGDRPAWAAEGDPQRRPVREVLQRPHDRRVRGGHLGGGTVPGGVTRRRPGPSGKPT